MTHPRTSTFPKGILMIGRFMLLSILSIIFTYYDSTEHVFHVPDHHLIKTIFNIIYITCGLLLISKRLDYVRAALFIIAAIMVSRIIMVIIGQTPIVSTLNIIFFTLGLGLHIFFFVYIRRKINQYNKDSQLV